ncbi:snRNA-activating protein complex subunit 3 [Coccomyxa sp. Obi]|nr:snRNA-activating protein complex subunit 3 [Coccomyxa sp. Obi]
MSRKKRRRQAQESASKKPKEPRRKATSTAGQHGDAALALQAAAISQGNEELRHAAMVVTGAVLPASFPASNLISLNAFQAKAKEVAADFDREVEDTDCAHVSVAELQLPCHPESAHRTEPNPASSNSLAANTFERQLETTGQVLTVLKKRLESRKGPVRFHYRDKPLEKPHMAANEQHAEEGLPDDEVLLTVGILRYGQSYRMQEFIVAGSQRLTDLRDALVCPADVNLRALGIAVPSGYFYIEGTFYNDMRAPDSVDYSEPIISFCQQNNLLPPPTTQQADQEARPRGNLNLEGVQDNGRQAVYKKADMHTTRFKDLGNLCIGFFPGYVYCHQGCCEHGLYFRDIRRIHPDDSHALSDYPIPVYQAQTRRQRCTVCATRFAVKVTYEDRLAPETPAFWCSECYEAIHYESSGRLKYVHKVFPYQIN